MAPDDALATWCLDDLTTTPEETLNNALQFANNFSKIYKKLSDSSPKAEELLKAIQDYEALMMEAGKATSYASLAYHANLKDPTCASFYQKAQEVFSEIQQITVFFDVWMTRLPPEIFDTLCKEEPRLKHYESWARRIRRFSPHLLGIEHEQLMLAKALTSNQAWVRLYDETLAGIGFILDGKTHPLETVISNMSSSQPDQRQKAAQSLSNGLNAHLDTFVRVTNVLAKDKSIDDKWRKYNTPQASRHLANEVSAEAVEALVSTVRKNYKNLSHRYYALKAKLLKVDRLNYWDRNAPLTEVEEAPIPYKDAQTIVKDAYQAFSPTLANHVQSFFDHRWIDVYTRDGKGSGAFCHPTVTDCHPYILLNYQGKRRDVMTLAHELGHGVHDLLSNHHGYLCADIPLTLAETASVFGEMLTFKYFVNTSSSDQKKYLLASKIEDMLNTVVRQIAFYQFECLVHETRVKRELSSEDLSQFWALTQEEALGESVIVNESCRNYWGYISHFIHSPFYVYAYAFGDCLVNSLYQAYEEKPEGFEKKYIELLKAGGTQTYTDLLKPFGLDASKSDFWQLGLTLISRMIDEFEALLP